MIHPKKGAFGAPFFISLQTGFTLVELMVVVAIIGFLSAIAIPNFRKFQAKSKTTEAKLQLAAVYTAQASFFGTYHMYHICLSYMGYDPTEFRAGRYYTVGFNNAAAVDAVPFTAAVNLGILASDCPQAMAVTIDKTYFLPGSGIGNAMADFSYLPPTSLGDQTGTTQMTFVAGAGGVIFKDFTTSTNASAFTINEKKQIVTVRTGY